MPVHCLHALCPVCLDAEVRRLRAQLDAERSRCAQLEKKVRRLEQLTDELPTQPGTKP